MTKNDSFMSFVDFAVKQALEPYRTAEGHGGVQVRKRNSGAYAVRIMDCMPVVTALQTRLTLFLLLLLHWQA